MIKEPFNLIYFLFGFVCLMEASVADEVERLLRAEGVLVSSSGARLAAENELTLGLREVTKYRRNLVSAEKRFEDFKKAQSALNLQITRINQQSAKLNSQLANVRDVATNNRLVGAINTINAQLRLAYQRQEKLSDQESSVHAEVSDARDELISHATKMRSLADVISARYIRPTAEVVALLKNYNATHQTDIKLEASSVFNANLRKIELIESNISSNNISLRREGNTYWARVRVNGGDPVEMIVDSGASLVTLPYKTAIDLGLKPGPQDPEIRMIIADGRVISGYQMIIKELRLGEFVANDVECAVLSPDAVNAEPLLGMSFLGNFKFEMDAGKSSLSITQYGEGSSNRTGSSHNASIDSIDQGFELNRPGWRLAPTVRGLHIWSDRSYEIVSLPPELRNSLTIVMPYEKGDWLKEGDLIASNAGTFFIAVTKQSVTNRRGRKKTYLWTSDDTINAYIKDGWRIIEPMVVSPPDATTNEWILFAKEIAAGTVVIDPPAKLDQRRFYMVKSANAPSSRPLSDKFKISHNRWSLQETAVGSHLLAERTYSIMAVPDELQHSTMLIRGPDDMKGWINGEVIATKPGTFYVAILSSRFDPGKKDRTYLLSQDQIDGFLASGWKEIDGFKTTSWEKADWHWKVFSKEIATGPVTLLPPVAIDENYIFFFK